MAATETKLGSWIPKRSSFERYPDPATLGARREVQQKAIAGAQAAVRDVFDPWFNASLNEGASPARFETMLRDMHRTIVGHGYAGFMNGPNTEPVVPGQMLKDLHPSDYRHPYAVQLHRRSIWPLHRMLVTRVAPGTEWHLDFPNLTRAQQPFGSWFNDHEGAWLTHEYAPVGVHDELIAQAAGHMHRARSSVKDFEAIGQKPQRDSQAFTDLVDALGDFHRTALAPQMFDRINSTIVLAMANRSLSRIGAAQITPGRLDEHAMVLPRAQFLSVFREAVRIALTAERDRPL